MKRLSAHPQPSQTKSFLGSSSRIFLNLSATVLRASSQVISTQPGSTSGHFSGFVLLRGPLTRYGLYNPMIDEIERIQIFPWLVGQSGFPTILVTTPSSMWTSVPSSACIHIMQKLGIHRSSDSLGLSWVNWANAYSSL